MRYLPVVLLVLFGVLDAASALPPTTAPTASVASSPPVDPGASLAEGWGKLNAGANREALTILKEGIRALGHMPAVLADGTAIKLFHCAAVASLRLDELSSAKRYMDRVTASGQTDRVAILNAATIEIKIKGFNLHAVQILDSCCTSHATDELAMDLFGVALDRAASVKINADRLADHIKSYSQCNEKLEATRPGQRRWGTKWMGDNDYALLQNARNEALSYCDYSIKRLTAAQANLQNAQDAYNTAQGNSLIRRGNNYSASTLDANVNSAQTEVNSAQQRLDDAKAKVPLPTWECDLSGLLPVAMVNPALATEPASPSPTAVAGAPGVKPAAVAFVVDTSGSMISLMEAVKLQMGEAINNLSVDQRFEIFAVTAEGTKCSSSGLVSASDENKNRAATFIVSLRAGGDGQPDDALSLAATASPDVIWLLTDGDMNDPKTLMQVVHRLPSTTRVNTAVLSRYAKDECKKLVLQIAADTNGICIDPEGKKLPLPPKTGEAPVVALPKGRSIFDAD